MYLSSTHLPSMCKAWVPFLHCKKKKKGGGGGLKSSFELHLTKFVQWPLYERSLIPMLGKCSNSKIIISYKHASALLVHWANTNPEFPHLRLVARKHTREGAFLSFSYRRWLISSLCGELISSLCGEQSSESCYHIDGKKEIQMLYWLGCWLSGLTWVFFKRRESHLVAF
jgi:hypothetical protein